MSINEGIVHEPYTGNEIAIIGMSGRFPGAQSVAHFWQNLQDGKEGITFLSEEILIAAGVDQSLIHDPQYVNAYGVLEEIELFDAAFFEYSPQEARLIDPQHRIFLECAWHALEDSGYDPHRYAGLIGVFAGGGFNSYLISNLLPNLAHLDDIEELQIAISSEKDYLTTRASYKLNLRGPSFDVQTACSTSLVAIHLASQSLLAGECDMALAGGVSITNLDKTGYFYQEGSILSPDGHCRAFDADAQGTVFGDGVAVLVLKRLEDALADKDHIEAIIKGSAINNDGAAKVGFTAPSVQGQTAVIADALAVADVEPDTISYIETHGTGTPIGDPIEITALNRVFATVTNQKNFCALGSVKTNVGHLNTVAGATGVIKTVLALKHKQIPPSLHFNAPNPQIDFADSPFFVNTILQAWPHLPYPRRAGVSSFGIGGTNAHIILEEAPTIAPTKTVNDWQILPFSARTKKALNANIKQLRDFLIEHPKTNMADVAYTLQSGRSSFKQRAVVLCRNRDEAVNALDGDYLADFTNRTERPVAFLFPGQGSQYVNMGRNLYHTSDLFRDLVEHCCELIEPQLGIDLRRILYPSEAETTVAAQKLNQTWLTQPALFIIEYALAHYWMDLGIQPQAMIGHSIGEFVAACLAKVMSLPDALRLITQRGQLMQQTKEGTMLAVALPAEKAELYCKQADLSLATVNAPNQVVLSGANAAIDVCISKLNKEEIPYKRLPTFFAFHSRLMEPILESFAKHVRQVKLNPPHIPYISNVTGDWITSSEATSVTYWVNHLRQTVQWSDGIQKLAQQKDLAFLEVGPGHALSNLAKQSLVDDHTTHPILTSLKASDNEKDEPKLRAKTIGNLWLAGINIDWKHNNCSPRRISLPGYPFDRQRFWLNRKQVTPPQQYKKAKISDWYYLPVWKQQATHLLSSKHNKTSPQQWLIFNDEYGIGKAMTSRLTQAEHQVITVTIDDTYHQLDKSTYSLSPENPEQFDHLFSALNQEQQFPQNILFLWSIDPCETNTTLVERLNTIQYRNYLSLIYLIQAIGKMGKQAPLQFYTISNNLFNVWGNDALCPEQALISAPSKIIPKEYPHISWQHIDIALSQDETGDLQDLLDTLAKTFFINTPVEAPMAIRGKHLWQQTYERVRLKTDAKDVGLSNGSTYLITGGLGGIGYTIAAYLAHTTAANLILTGRTPLPPPSAWEDWLKSNPPEATEFVNIKKLQALEKAGVAVTYQVADVTNFEEMQEALAVAQEQVGQINGVIHAAGVPGEGVTQWKTAVQVKQTMKPKVEGTLNLSSLLIDNDLEFFILCSSLVSILGGIGQIDYCAANAFLDAFAQHLSLKNNLPIISINWDTWSEIGMAVNASVPQALKQEWDNQLETAISPSEGIEAFKQILFHRPTQILVATHDYFNEEISSETGVQKPKMDDAHLEPASRPELDVDFAPPRNSIERRLVELWQSLLGIERVGIHDNFFALGGHSLLAIQLLSRVNQVFDVQLSLATINEYSTIIDLATLIVQQHAAEEEVTHLEEMLDRIETLSDVDINQLLADLEGVSDE